MCESRNLVTAIHRKQWQPRYQPASRLDAVLFGGVSAKSIEIRICCYMSHPSTVRAEMGCALETCITTEAAACLQSLQTFLHLPAIIKCPIEDRLIVVTCLISLSIGLNQSLD